MAEKKTGLLKQYFIRQSIKEATVESFIRKAFPLGDYSKTELQRTPLGLKVIIWTNKPGKIIGRGGKTINEMTDALKSRFDLENLQIDVKTIENADLDAKIVAKQIASALLKGFNYKKIANLTMKRIMDAGALGARIRISGCMGGAKSMTFKMTEGYIKHCGQPAKELVDDGFEVANTKRSSIGVRVKIMKEYRDICGASILSRKAREVKKEAIVEELAKIDEKEEMLSAELEESKKPKAAEAKAEKKVRKRKIKAEVTEAGEAAEPAEAKPARKPRAKKSKAPEAEAASEEASPEAAEPSAEAAPAEAAE